MKVNRISIVMLIVVLIWITGCSKEAVSEEDFPPIMTGMVVVNEQEYEMKAGNFKWERQVGFNTEIVRTDAAAPNQLAESYEPISVQQNESILIEIEGDPNIDIFLWDADGPAEEVKQTDNQIAAHADSGRYIYEALATWPKGEVSYTFVVQVD